ncbi:hypothetical protein P4Q82_003970 [Salmonella enterica]|nr:hypothetical protein [Salmonella enterica]
MKKSLLILAALSLSISGVSQAAGQINEQVLREKAAFALGGHRIVSPLSSLIVPLTRMTELNLAG